MTHILSIDPSFLLSYWWVAAIVLAVASWKFVLRVFLGMVIVPEDKLGIVTKKFVLFGANKEMPDGRIIASNGEAGIQAQTLAPGLYWFMWPWQYGVEMTSFTIIPEGKLGLILARDGAQLPVGHILGRKVECNNFQDAAQFIKNNGQKGRQTMFLTAGSYRIHTGAFEVHVVDMITIAENMVGIVTTLDGQPLEKNQIAGDSVEGHNNFQDIDSFLDKGGKKGLQPQVILAGSYYINPWAVQIEETPMTDVPIGSVAVVISYIGKEGVDTSGESFKHGNIVGANEKGVWKDPLGPGKYPINKYTTKIEIVPTTNLVLNWANARSEAHNLDKNLSTITVRSKDGFPFNLDVAQIIHVPANEAPKVIARFGSMNNLVSQVLEPTIGNYFRNSAQDSDVISFLSTRKERQEDAKRHIGTVLEEYNVNAVDTLIGDIVPPESLMKTLTDRKIAEEEKITYNTQMGAQQVRETLEKATAVADMQKEVVKATQSVEIAQRNADAAVKKAEGDASAKKLNAGAEAEATKLKANADAERIKVTGNAEAEKIKAIGASTAEAYEAQVKAMGPDQFASLQIIKQIAEGNVQLVPQVMGGSGNGGDGLIGSMFAFNQMQNLGFKMPNQNQTTEKPAASEDEKK